MEPDIFYISWTDNEDMTHIEYADTMDEANCRALVLKESFDAQTIVIVKG